MESSLNASSVLDRERRKRIQRREYVFEFSTNATRVAIRTETNADRAMKIIKKDWRNDGN